MTRLACGAGLFALATAMACSDDKPETAPLFVVFNAGVSGSQARIVIATCAPQLQPTDIKFSETGLKQATAIFVVPAENAIGRCMQSQPQVEYASLAVEG